MSNTPITYQYTDRYGPVTSALAEATGNWLKDIGLNPVAEIQDYASKYITQTIAGNFHGITYMNTPGYSEVGLFVNRCFGDDPWNTGRVKDPAITSLLQKQKVELNIDQRSALIRQIQLINAQKMYYVPTQTAAGWTAYRPEIQGIARTRGYAIQAEVIPFMWMHA